MGPRRRTLTLAVCCWTEELHTDTMYLNGPEAIFYETDAVAQFRDSCL
jgi:hypothetical protein